MLRQCLEHGYFRGQICSVCDQKGRFLMNDNELNGLGRILAGILRHFPEKFNLKMDKQGWVVISTLIDAISNRTSQYHWFRPHHLLALVETDKKGRYQIKDNLIRATYGHSLDLELDLPTDNIPDKLYYPTTKEEVELLMETGLKPSDRKKVHLSLTYEDAENAGRVRVPHPLILEIDATASINAGNLIGQAGTTVFTTDEIPSEFITLLNADNIMIQKDDGDVEGKDQDKDDADPDADTDPKKEDAVDAAQKEEEADPKTDDKDLKKEEEADPKTDDKDLKKEEEADTKTDEEVKSAAEGEKKDKA